MSKTMSHKSIIQGAYCTLDDLMRVQIISKRARRHRSQSSVSLEQGNKKSHIKSRGLEFEEVRMYQAGDDTRNIDWRVTARSGKAHTKIFTEEKERPVFIVIDQRLSHFIGSKTCFKSVFGAHLTALIAWKALAKNDRVGGLIFNDNQHRVIRPQRSKLTVLQLLQEVCNYNQALNKSFAIETPVSVSLNNALQETMSNNPKGTSVYVISDFIGYNNESLKWLTQISKHNRVNCIHIADQIEQRLPSISDATVTNGTQSLKINMMHSDSRDAFEQQFIEHQEMLKNQFLYKKIHYSLYYTHNALDDAMDI
jgi:uncharacterized protein (DUF58 family)